MCVYLQEEPRTQLAPFEGREIVFQAYFVRFGNITPEVDNTDSVTILLKNPYTYENGEYVRLGHHIWTPYPPGIEKLKLEHGDRIKGTGQVVSYTKKNGDKDYSIRNIHDCSVVERNKDPGKYNCFDFTDTVKTAAKAFMRLKDEQKYVRASQFKKSDGTLVRQGEVEFKMRDVLSNGVCRYYYRAVDDEEYSRYAYFSIKNGQVMTLNDGNGESRRFILSNENYFSIKDFIANVRYSGKYKLPLSYKDIEIEREKEKGKSSGRWKSVRRCRPDRENTQKIDKYGKRVPAEK